MPPVETFPSTRLKREKRRWTTSSRIGRPCATISSVPRASSSVPASSRPHAKPSSANDSHAPECIGPSGASATFYPSEPQFTPTATTTSGPGECSTAKPLDQKSVPHAFGRFADNSEVSPWTPHPNMVIFFALAAGVRFRCRWFPRTMQKDKTRAHCPRCRHQQIFVRAQINHPLHLILAVLTAGLWLVSWLALCLGKSIRPWRCEHCGWHVPDFGDHLRRARRFTTPSTRTEPTFAPQAAPRR